MGQRPIVLILIKGLGLGGAERLISEAVPIWDRTRFDYRVAYLLPWKDQLVEEIVAQGIPVTLVGTGRMGPAVARGLRRLIVESGADLVHVHSPAVAVLARLVSPVPVVYTEHNLADSYRQPTRTLNRLTYAKNANVVAVSEAVAGSVSGFSGSAARVIENGVACHVTDEERLAVRDELELNGGRRLIVHVGNIRPYKGHRTLLAASEIMGREHPDVLTVSVGGEKFPGDLEALRAEARQKGLAESVRFLGRRDDARAFLAAADIVVNPSDVEGLPVAVLEAMALGRPIVATAVGGVPDLIINEKTGLLTEPGDANGLADAIGRLLARPDWATALGAEAKVAVERDHGLEPMVRAVEQVYEETLRAG